MKNITLSIVSLFVLNSCSILKPSPKNTFVDGFYLQKKEGEKQKVYVDIENETLRVHATQKNKNQTIIDSSAVCEFYPEKLKNEINEKSTFSKHSFDVDFLTIPLKYRFPKYDVPQQLNTNLNGAVYFGHRIDKYAINYQPNPLKESLRNTTHYGFSFGVFTGLGNTAMTPTNTFNRISQEYEGVVWNKGFAGIFAIDNFTVGVALGFDNLLDINRKVWIYEQKSWFGVAFGLNLN